MTFATIKARSSKPFPSFFSRVSTGRIKNDIEEFDLCREEDTQLSIIQTNAHLCSKDGLMVNLSEYSHSLLSLSKVFMSCFCFSFMFIQVKKLIITMPFYIVFKKTKKIENLSLIIILSS